MAGDQERVGPLFDVLADVESWALWAGAGLIIQHHESRSFDLVAY